MIGYVKTTIKFLYVISIAVILVVVISSCQKKPRIAVTKLSPANDTAVVVVKDMSVLQFQLKDLVQRLSGKEQYPTVANALQSQWGVKPFDRDELKSFSLNPTASAAFIWGNDAIKGAAILPVDDDDTFIERFKQLLIQNQGAYQYDKKTFDNYKGWHFYQQGNAQARNYYLTYHMGYMIIAGSVEGLLYIAKLPDSSDNLEQSSEFKQLYQQLKPTGSAYLYNGKQPDVKMDPSAGKVNGLIKGSLHDITISSKGLNIRGKSHLLPQAQADLQRVFSSEIPLNKGLAKLDPQAMVWSIISISPVALPELFNSNLTLRKTWATISNNIKESTSLEVEKDLLPVVVPPVILNAYINNIAQTFAQYMANPKAGKATLVDLVKLVVLTEFTKTDRLNKQIAQAKGKFKNEAGLQETLKNGVYLFKPTQLQGRAAFVVKDNLFSYTAGTEMGEYVVEKLQKGDSFNSADQIPDFQSLDRSGIFIAINPGAVKEALIELAHSPLGALLQKGGQQSLPLLIAEKLSALNTIAFTLNPAQDGYESTFVIELHEK